MAAIGLARGMIVALRDRFNQKKDKVELVVLAVTGHDHNWGPSPNKLLRGSREVCACGAERFPPPIITQG